MELVWIQHVRIQDGCHHHVESEWMSEVLFVQNGWIQDGRVQDDCHHQVEWEWMSLSQIELVWVRVLCKMAESKMAEFKMAAIIKLSQNEWVKFFLCKGLNPIHGRIQDGCHHQVESEWMSEVLFVQNGWIKDGRFQDSCNHQVESEWMSEVFLWKCWELILASVSEFERTN